MRKICKKKGSGVWFEVAVEPGVETSAEKWDLVVLRVETSVGRGGPG